MVASVNLVSDDIVANFFGDSLGNDKVIESPVTQTTDDYYLFKFCKNSILTFITIQHFCSWHCQSTPKTCKRQFCRDRAS